VERSSHGHGGPGASEAATRAALEEELRRLTSGDPFTALRVGYDADDRAVRQAFLGATKRLHPNRFARHEPPVRALANEVFLKIRDAYEQIETGEGRAKLLGKLGRAPTAPVVGDGSRSVPVAFPNVPRVTMTPPGGTKLGDIRPPTPEPRAPTPEPRPPTPQPRPVRHTPAAAPAVSVDDVRKQVLERDRQIEEEFAAAVKKLDQGFVEVARREFHRLAVADPGDKKFRAWMHLAKGREHQGAGRLDEARSEYRRALDLDAGFSQARGALAALDDGPGGDKPSGGLFSRLFRK
jgi:hypothetical protein